MNNNTITDEKALSKALKLGGYDKKQVLSYIESIRGTYELTVNQLEKKVVELDEEKNKLISQTETLEARMSVMDSRLYEEQSRVGNLNITINDLNVEIASQRVIINDREKIIMEYKNDAKLSDEHMRQLSLKAKKYDEVKESIGAVILEAKSNASVIIEKSQLKAKDILKDAEIRLSTINNDIVSLRHQFTMARKFLGDLNRTVNDKLDNMDIVVNSIDHSVNYDVSIENTATKLHNIIGELSQDKEDLCFDISSEQ